MIEIIKELVTFIAPFISGIITTILIPIIIKNFSVKSLQRKINEIEPTSEMIAIKKELKEIKEEILQMRGKRK